MNDREAVAAFGDMNDPGWTGYDQRLRESKRMTPRTYAVWIKGQRISTERRIVAGNRLDALAVFARSNGLKTFQCDAVWVRIPKHPHG